MDHFKKLVTKAPDRNPKLLQYFGTNDEGLRSYDDAVKAIQAGNLDGIFTFVVHR